MKQLLLILKSGYSFRVDTEKTTEDFLRLLTNEPDAVIQFDDHSFVKCTEIAAIIKPE